MSRDLLPVEALDRLSRQEGVDVRPILLRVLTDLFVQKAHHAPEEIARYEELALQLLDVVETETRAVVAVKLARDARAPDAVIRRLLDDQLEVKVPILAASPKAPRSLLITLAIDGSAAEASAVAQRPDLDPDLVRLLVHHREDDVLEALSANPAVTPGEAPLATLVRRAQTRPSLAASLLRRMDLDAAALAPLYLAASPARRADIRAALAVRPSRPRTVARAASAIDAVDAAVVEAALESGSRPLVAEALGDALSLSSAVVATLAAEASGEPFVVMLRAIGLERDAIARALLIGQPEIAQSTTRFFELVDLAERTTRTTALELIAAIVGETPQAAAVRHEPTFEPLGAHERAGAARSSAIRRPTAKLGEARRRS